jgi:hypothetical protein
LRAGVHVTKHNHSKNAVYVRDLYRLFTSQALQCGQWEDELVNPRLVVCLLASVPLGMLAALASLAAGGGALLALLTYCAGGSLALVALALLLETGDASAPRPAPAPLPRRPAVSR